MSMIVNPYVYGGAGGGSDPNFSSVVFLSHFEGTNGSTSATDESNSAHAITITNSEISTAKAKFGSSSLNMTSGSVGGKCRCADSADWAFGSGQFTVEAWVNFNSVANFSDSFVCQDDLVSRSWRLGRHFIGGLRFSFTTDGTTLITVDGAFTFVADTWYHVAVDRDSGGVIRVYVDGVVKGSITNTGTVYNGTSGMVIGNTDNGGEEMSGHIDEVRITKGVARYAGAFTPPTAAFPDS